MNKLKGEIDRMSKREREYVWEFSDWVIKGSNDQLSSDLVIKGSSDKSIKCSSNQGIKQSSTKWSSNQGI